ncbi:MAG: hypothetical protein AB7T06_28830 [Kofleriaceae bacterium]
MKLELRGATDASAIQRRVFAFDGDLSRWLGELDGAECSEPSDVLRADVA